MSILAPDPVTESIRRYFTTPVETRRMNPQAAYSMFHDYGDTWLASIYGSSAAFMGAEPTMWNMREAMRDPEALRVEEMFMAARSLSPEAAAADDYCSRIPIPLRYMLAPCVGASAGRALAKASGAAEFFGLSPEWKRNLTIGVVGVGLILIGAVAIAKP